MTGLVTYSPPAAPLLPAGFNVPGHLIIVGRSGAGKTVLARHLITAGVFGDDARFNVVCRADETGVFRSAGPQVVNVDSGREGFVSAVAGVHSIMRERRRETVEDRRVLLLDDVQPFGGFEAIDTTSRRLRALFTLGRAAGISVVLTTQMLHPRVVPRDVEQNTQTIVTVDYPFSGEASVRNR